MFTKKKTLYHDLYAQPVNLIIFKAMFKPSFKYHSLFHCDVAFTAKILQHKLIMNFFSQKTELITSKVYLIRI